MRTSSEHPPAAAEYGERTPNAQRTVSAFQDPAPLIPVSPPGRVTRKARQYVAQILRLREQGYTLETIQQALANVGVKVSVSTVRREALRPMPKPLPYPIAVAAPPAAIDTAGPSPPAKSRPKPASPIDGLPPASAKDLAEAYALSRSQNPLVRAKEQSS